MCDWLSYGEWCDVKLLCGGRAFSAHRAVLASVSTFLRHILLSCPTDESPTFIVLPEFDLDAMSLVLYYIYNGEVTVQKHKLDRFLDIIKAMQIFVDSQYLPQTTCNNYHYSGLDYNNETDLSKNNIFTLGLVNDQDQTCINIRKGNAIRDIVTQVLQENLELRDKRVDFTNEIAEGISSVGNLKSSDVDRQRNNSLRDLFIETYPRNGNVNGLTTSVLAIPNGCYRIPESVLLTNANGNHLNVDDILFESYEKMSKQISESPTIIHIDKQKQCTRVEQDYGENSRSFSFENIHRYERLKNASVIQVGLHERVLTGIDNGIASSTVNEAKPTAVSNILAPSVLENIDKKFCNRMDKKSIPKRVILNHVIEGPWSPRMPHNFKPFRRKTEMNIISEVTVKNMCDWLSYGEWCDVKLLCGGRAFSAHRAVLASVSTFLRHILLSCPTDESPTFIVLPEFDLDAMSLVLYYIYNGEVTVQKHKLDRFLDIIKAMQIFVDSQYLPQTTCNNYHYSGLDYNNETDLSKNNIFTLGLVNDQDQTCINIRKGNAIRDIVTQVLQENLELRDKRVDFTNEIAEGISSVGNLKSSDVDRQRNNSLRDLFIETYPRNGNVNGLTTSVLAIPNGCYRIPESVLLTNANGNHLNVDDILFESYEKMSKQISESPTIIHIDKQKQCTRVEQDYGENSRSFSFENIHRYERLKNASVIQVGLHERVLTGIDNGIASSTVNEAKPTAVSNILAPSVLENIDKKFCNRMDKKSIPKRVILNHVIEGPWSPRMPHNFKPFRRKTEMNIISEVTVKNETNNTINNDSNNNVDECISSINLSCYEEINKPVEDKCKTTIGAERSDVLQFKCNVCNQVFMTRDSLSVHMRRHTVHARYTCGDCGKTFSQLRNFKYHMSIHRGTREYAATCSVCGKYFNDRGYLSSHMKIHRNRKEYKCHLCPKSFNQRVAYNMHVRIHTGIKPHVCEQCGKAFSRKMLLKQHQRTHSGERPYACPHCDKRFADRSNMTLHLRLHTGIKPFSCTLCPKSFTKKHHLKSHLNFHTGSKPYSCPRCKLAFTQSSNMRTHLKKCRAPETLPDTEAS